jgi:DNA-binding NtrC family response regulator
MNILIVDDEPSVCRVLYTALFDKHSVSILTNGHNAVCVLADPSHGFDLVMLDMHMPRLSGPEVIKMINDIVNTNFIIISGDSNIPPEITRRHMVLHKPFTIDNVREAIEKIRKKRAGHSANWGQNAY